MVPYMGKQFVAEHYRCPSDRDWMNRSYKYSYTINEYISGYAGYNHPTLKITEIRRSAEKILMIDESSATVDDGCWAPQNYSVDGQNLLSNRHDKKAEVKTDPNAGRGNVLFADMHAEFYPRKDSTKIENYDPAK
jgi:prepilin-type processing-associated H-X9-DG protein